MRDEAHAALDRLLDAAERALSESSPDAQISARSDARRLWVELTRSVDREGVLSEAYRERANADAKTEEEAAAEEETEKRKFALNVAAQMLVDLGGKSGSFKGPVASGLSMVGGSIIDILLERKGTGTFDTIKRGRGKRERSIVVKAAMREFARLVHYKKGRDGLGLQGSFESMHTAISWRTFEDRQKVLSRQDRETAHGLGESLRNNVTLSAAQQDQADKLEAFLTDLDSLEKLKSMIVGEFDHPA